MKKIVVSSFSVSKESVLSIKLNVSELSNDVVVK